MDLLANTSFELQQLIVIAGFSSYLFSMGFSTDGDVKLMSAVWGHRVRNM
jgi:hypothetical protein